MTFTPNSEGIGADVAPASPQTPGERPGGEQAYAERWCERLPEAPKLLRDIAADIEDRHPMSAVTLGLVADDVEEFRAALASGHAALLACGHCGDGFTGDDIADGDIAGVVCTMCAKAGRAADRLCADTDQERADSIAVGLMRMRDELDRLIAADREIENGPAARSPRPETAQDDADEREADLYARLSQQWYAERAAGIPRGSLIAAESVTCNYLMNYDEKNGDLASLARAIVAEIAGALVTLPGEGAAARSPREESASAADGDCPACDQSAEVCESIAGCCEQCAEVGRISMHARTTPAETNEETDRGR